MTFGERGLDNSIRADKRIWTKIVLIKFTKFFQVLLNVIWFNKFSEIVSMNLNFTTLQIRHILTVWLFWSKRKLHIKNLKKNVQKDDFCFKKDINQLYHCTCLNLSVHYCGCTFCVEVMSILIARFSGLLADCSAWGDSPTIPWLCKKTALTSSLLWTP